MNNAVDNVFDVLCKDAVERAENPDEAQLLMANSLAKLIEKSMKTNWQSRFEQLGRDSQTPCLSMTPELEQRLNEMVKAAIEEAQLNQLKAQPPQEVPKTAKKGPGKIVPRDLPAGTVYVRDFYEKHNVSYSNFRRHTERGFDGDLLEVTERRPFPETRPNYKDRYLTPEQQQKAIAYWIEHNTPYTVPESDQE